MVDLAWLLRLMRRLGDLAMRVSQTIPAQLHDHHSLAHTREHPSKERGLVGGLVLPTERALKQSQSTGLTVKGGLVEQWR